MTLRSANVFLVNRTYDLWKPSPEFFDAGANGSAATASDIAQWKGEGQKPQPTDKNILEGLENCIIGDGVQRYRELRVVEARLDATTMRKRLDIQDAINCNVKASLCGRI